MQGGGGSPEQSQRVVFGYQLDENYSQTSARRGRPRSYAQARALAFNAKGEKPAEPVLSKQSVLADAVKSNAKGEKPAEPVPYLVPSDWTTKNPYCHSELVSESVPRCKLVPNIGQTLNQVQGDNRLLACVGFTMAEILLSLTIIGVVAAITLPSLTGNINERTWNTQRKALYARFSQAIALMPALNGYGTYETISAGGSTSINDTAAETFVTNGLSKVLKINNICDKDHVFDCGFASSITTYSANQISLPRKLSDLNHGIVDGTAGLIIKNTNAAAFETANGESILAFYNPNCVSDGVVVVGANDAGHPGYYMKQHVCANFLFDLNGSKGPNTVGKDIGFMTVIFPTDSNVVMPLLARKLEHQFTQTDSSRQCANLDADNRLPNIYELLSMYYNRMLIDWSGGSFWSATVVDSQNAWVFGFGYGMKYSYPKNTALDVQCVKRN